MENHIGKMVRELLSQRTNLTIKNFAEKLGVHEQTVYDIYKRADLSTDLLRKISEILEVPVTYFLFPEANTTTQDNNTSYSMLNNNFNDFFLESTDENQSIIPEPITPPSEEKLTYSSPQKPPYSAYAMESFIPDKSIAEVYDDFISENSIKIVPSHPPKQHIPEPTTKIPPENHTHRETPIKLESSRALPFNRTVKLDEMPISVQHKTLQHIQQSKASENNLRNDKMSKDMYSPSTPQMTIETEIANANNNIEIARLEERLKAEIDRSRLLERMIQDKEHIIRLLESENRRLLEE